MYKVCVLMTTYNPKHYLDEQIKSIFKQKGVETEIIIRDDASVDKNFLKKYYNDKRITIIEGNKNVGVAGNIKLLLKYALTNKQEYDFFAYSDQDDVWKSDKLERICTVLSNMDSTSPALYYSNLLVVDEQLNPSHRLFKKNVVKNTLGQSLSQVFLFACTSGFNRKMIEEVVKYNFEILGFDSLLYYIGIIYQQIYYDEIPHILYRQHGDNVSGQKEKGWKYFVHKISTVLFKNKFATFRYNAQFLLENFMNLLSEQDKALVKKVAFYDTFTDRVKLLLNKQLKAGYQPKDFYRMCRILIGRY